jgi:hypothetical protein
MRRHIAFAAAPACALLVVAPFAAKADISTPAPPGKASAVAAQVGSLIDISKTSAVADQTTPTADASVIRIGGNTLFGLGGSQKGDGKQGGALLDTGANNPIRLELAPWAAAVEGTSGPTRHSKAAAALARANVANVVTAAVLHSESEASWTDTKSTGTAFSNGVELSLLNAINVVLLHSEVKSEGKGNSYLVGLNGTQIGTDDQLGKSPLCALTLPSLLSLSCLTASGGGSPAPAAGTPSGGAAEVAKVDPTVDAIKMVDPVDAFTASGTSGTGSAPIATLPAASAPVAAAADDVRAAVTPAAAAAPAAALPRTGAALAGLFVAGLVALLGGVLLRLTGRRRATG